MGRGEGGGGEEGEGIRPYKWQVKVRAPSQVRTIGGALHYCAKGQWFGSVVKAHKHDILRVSM